MEDQIDIKKAARQHLEMDMFFAGDFAVKDEAFEQDWPMDSPIPGKNDPNIAVGLEKIAAQAQKCRKCGLGTSRTKAVPGEGNPYARIAFIGEAPGAEEDASGRPFVGRAGKLLEKIINAMGMKRSDVFIGNILKCRPPSNRDPKPDEIVQCLPYLKEQLELMQPEIIVALGAHAARTLLDTNKPIGQLRGKLHEYYTAPDAPPIKLMATYHPAYLLRNYSYDSRSRVWDDMQKVLTELGLEPPKSRGK